jgi:hypothetical protein
MAQNEMHMPKMTMPTVFGFIAQNSIAQNLSPRAGNRRPREALIKAPSRGRQIVLNRPSSRKRMGPVRATALDMTRQEQGDVEMSN